MLKRDLLLGGVFLDSADSTLDFVSLGDFGEIFFGFKLFLGGRGDVFLSRCVSSVVRFC